MPLAFCLPMPFVGMADWYVGLLSIGSLFFHFVELPATWMCRLADVSQEGKEHTLVERDARAALAPFRSDAPAFTAKAFLEPGIVIDSEGIEAKQSCGSRKRVLWSEVESAACDIARDVTGHITGAEFVLQGAHEMPLLRFQTRTQAEQVLAAIRFYLRGEVA